MGMRRTIAAMIAPLRRRVLLSIGRAVLALVDDGRKLQVVQVQGLARETLDGIERVQQYGLTSHPHPGAECVVVAVGGMRQHPLVIAADDRRYRVTNLVRGEVCLYTDEDEPGNPHRVTLKRGREIALEAGTTALTLEPGGMTLVTPSGRQTWGT